MSQPLAFNLCRLSDVGWFCFTFHRQRGHLEMAPHLPSLAKDVKLGFNTGNRTPGRRVAVHYMAVGTGGQGGQLPPPPNILPTKKFKIIKTTTYRSVYRNMSKIG